MDKYEKKIYDLNHKLKCLAREVCELASSEITEETDPIFSASPAFSITDLDITNWDTAFSWGNHATAGYLTSTEGNADYFPLQGGTLTGSGGDGFIGFLPQVSKPTTPAANSLALYSSSTGQLGILRSNGFAGLLDFSALTADRVISFPNQAGSVILSAGDQSLSGIKTFTGTLRRTSVEVGAINAGSLWYNTADEVTNYERSFARWTTNIFELGTEVAGTGTNRSVRIYASNTNQSLTINPASPRYVFNGISGSGDQNIITVNGTYSSGGAVYYNAVSVYNTVSNSSTSTYTAYYASPFLSGSSGERKLIDLGTNTSSNGALATHTSRFKILVDGTTTLNGNATITGNLTMAGNIIPDGDNTRNIGSPTGRMAVVYAINVSKGNVSNSFNLAVTNTTDIYFRVQPTTNNFVMQSAGAASAENNYKVTINGTGATVGGLYVIGQIRFDTVNTYTDNASALADGRTIGQLYKLADGSLKIVI